MGHMLVATCFLKLALLQAGRCTTEDRAGSEQHQTHMAKATWLKQTLAESGHTEQVEGNHYFPADSIRREYFKPSSHTTVCPWKGTAHYYDVVVNGETNQNAAWYYPDPKPAAANIKDHVAFWKGVRVEEV